MLKSEEQQTQERERREERIRAAVMDALAVEPDLDASGIDVVVRGIDVTLRGTVADPAAMRRAEEAVARVRGVGIVRNEMREREREAVGEGDIGDFADERGPLATEFGTKEAAKATHDIDNDDGFHGN